MCGNNIQVITTGFTRPEDTNAYAAGDAISNATGTSHAVMTFTDVVRNKGKGGVMVDALLKMSTAAATALQCELWLFDTAPAAFEDNASFDPSDAEALNVVAILPFTTPYKSANNAVFHSDSKVVPFRCAEGSTLLYGALVARNAYTPGSAEVFSIDLFVAQD